MIPYKGRGRHRLETRRTVLDALSCLTNRELAQLTEALEEARESATHCTGGLTRSGLCDAPRCYWNLTAISQRNRQGRAIRDLLAKESQRLAGRDF